MIELSNQIKIQFSIGDKTDFIQTQDFTGMQILENTGGLKPILQLQFTIVDESIIPYLNQGNLINIRYGIQDLSNDSMTFQIEGDTSQVQMSLGKEISILASFYNNNFVGTQTTTNIEGKSFEALKQITEACNLKFNTNVTRTNDKQIWYPDGKTNCAMANYIAERAYKDDTTFFSFGFDCNNYYFYDINALIQEGPKWILSCKDSGSGENDKIVNIGHYTIDDSLQGQMSNIVGKNVQNCVYNLDTGELSQSKHKLKTFTTLGTNSLNINSTDCKSYSYYVTSGRDHENSVLAFNQNRRNNILFSSYVVRTSVPGQYRDFRLLDVVQLIPSIKDRAAEGFYIIAGITRQYSDGVYRTNLTLNRESANNITGNLEQGEK